MKHNQKIASALYRKLVHFYPQQFREQMGESMEQSFHDLYREQDQESFYRRLGFVLWMFGDTAIGITREYLRLIAEGNIMKHIFLTLRSPALISLLFVIPLMTMELVNRRGFGEGFPIPLFGLMWLLPLIFILTGRPLVRTIRAGSNRMIQPVHLVLPVILLILVAWLWTSLLIDQLPCFLGVPNCD
jgi:hypothetical protein